MKIRVQYQFDLEKFIADFFANLAPLLLMFAKRKRRLSRLNADYLDKNIPTKTVGAKEFLPLEFAETLPDNVRFCRNPNCKAILPGDSVRKDCNDRCKSAYHNYIRAKADFCS